MGDILNDCYVSLFNVKPTQSKIKELGRKVPIEIKQLANQWGWNDTEVRDEIYNWLKTVYKL